MARSDALRADGAARLLTEEIHAVHLASRDTYGSQQVHAERTLALGITVGHGAVEMLMHQAGIKGLPGKRRTPSQAPAPTASDLCPALSPVVASRK
jgi:hypothetical protein